MPQSHARILTHLVYATKNRERILGEDIRDELHRYTAGVLKAWDSPAILINSVEDHIHILYAQSRVHSLAKIVEKVKGATSRWIKRKGARYANFYWQDGYGGFSVSQSNVPEVTNYIARQQEHHRRKSFQDEFREFLRKHEIEFDERYVWD